MSTGDIHLWMELPDPAVYIVMLVTVSAPAVVGPGPARRGWSVPGRCLKPVEKWSGQLRSLQSQLPDLAAMGSEGGVVCVKSGFAAQVAITGMEDTCPLD